MLSFKHFWEQFEDKDIIPHDTDDGIYDLLDGVDGNTCVRFALECAKSVINITNNNKNVIACVKLVEKWLKNNKSVPYQQLLEMANRISNSVMYIPEVPANEALRQALLTFSYVARAACYASTGRYFYEYAVYAAGSAISAKTEIGDERLQTATKLKSMLINMLNSNKVYVKSENKVKDVDLKKLLSKKTPINALILRDRLLDLGFDIVHKMQEINHEITDDNILDVLTNNNYILDNFYLIARNALKSK
jgi:hypothetical protein